MPSLSYAICVCNESRELYSLVSFLLKVKDPEDEINILVDSLHVTPQVRSVLAHFKDSIVQNERDFDGKFATHRNYHISKCSGDYIFIIDPDEMPHEVLITNLKSKLIENTSVDLVYLPRINICPGFTAEWVKQSGFPINELGWINWPDNTPRIFKNHSEIRYSAKELHEVIQGAKMTAAFPADPQLALWHIKSIEKQDNRWDKNGNYVSPPSQSQDSNLYDKLM